MRLLNTQTFKFKIFLSGRRPQYAILSHTWGEDEVTLREFLEQAPTTLHRTGYQKIVQCCRVAVEQGFEWAWIDTCCIDKTDNAELTESINSMFRWYREATTCYVFLSDLSVDGNLNETLSHCRWFTRGWTLQELIAPPEILFYDRGWVMRGTGQDLQTQIADRTGIPPGVLSGDVQLEEISVCERMSWAAHRRTTRPEDAAYCLLGIFGVNMPMIYGEGQNAFRRLQEQIMQRSNDLTVLAWGLDSRFIPPHDGGMELMGRGFPLLAQSPNVFNRHKMAITSITALNALRGAEFNPEFAMTNKGLRITSCLLRLHPEEGPDSSGRLLYFLGLGEFNERGTKEKHPGRMIGITLNKLGHDMYVRRDSKLRVLCASDEENPRPTFRRAFYIQVDDIWTRPTKALWAYGRISMPLTSVRVLNHRGGLGPKHVSINVVRAIPETHWDETNRLFFRSSKKLIVFAASLSLSFGKTEVSLFTLINQQQEHPKAYLMFPKQHPELYDWFLLRKAEIESHYWDDVPGQLLQKISLWYPDHVQVMVNNSLYSITVRVGVGNPQMGNGGDPRHELQFEVRRMDDKIKELSRL
ncbi:heterokaryon incompatibility protein-domain-containing protein [Cladorrhinum sp. PSN259]|nr:heterokaryon incompatibility protein-domain-containing protein [Cladorrhinum sp. PSN259]